MSLGLARRKELQKRRSQRFWGFVKFLIMMVVIVSTAFYAYDTGFKIADGEIQRWKNQYEQEARQNEKLQSELGSDKATLEQLKALVPSEDTKNLLTVINDRVIEGVKVARMARVIKGLTLNQKCNANSNSRRFMVITPVSPERNSSVSFMRGMITVSGQGSAALSKKGNPEAWFDPQKDVSINFTLPGGEKQETKGTLPLYYSMVVGENEYRFSINAGRRSFADVSVQKCGL